MTREGLRPAGEAPKAIRDYLAEIGGRNEHKEPIFRLCLAQHRYDRLSGDWEVWPDEAGLEDCHALGIAKAFQMEREGFSAQEIREAFIAGLNRRPASVKSGVSEVRRYEQDGWILERWIPAHCYGSPDAWYQFMQHGAPKLGPYPHCGDYEYLAPAEDSSWLEIPSMGELRLVIRSNMELIENRSPNPKVRQAQRLARRIEARKRLQRDRDNAIDARVRDLAPLMNRLSLGAGRVRQQLADDAGLSGHYGN